MRRLGRAVLGLLAFMAASSLSTALDGEAASLKPQGGTLPIVVNTWTGPCFTQATAAAWRALEAGGRQAALDAVEQGCTRCEELRCDRTVGFGGSPDEEGEVSLDALIMCGDSMRAGGVANLRRVRQATVAARAVLERTRHTLLAGDQADRFAASMGLAEGSLSTDESREMHRSWLNNSCQPNFRQRVLPDPAQACGPYRPASGQHAAPQRPRDWQQQPGQAWPSAECGHDTIAMVAVDAGGSVAAGSSSNGAIHKVPGRVGDAAVPGGGAYADSEVGGCGATGDGDVHLAFLPCYQVVESMRRGLGPREAAEDAIRRIARRVSGFVGAVVAVSRDGRHGGAAHGWRFAYSVAGAGSGGEVQTVQVEPLTLEAARPAAAATQ